MPDNPPRGPAPGVAAAVAINRRQALLAAVAALAALASCGAVPLVEAARPAKPAPAPASTGQMPAALRAVIQSAGLPLACIGLQVQAVAADAPPLASLNAEQPYQLASTTKLVTALAALHLLGRRYRWRTNAYLTGPLQQGRLAGDLLIVGGGNALLRSDELQAWFGRMQAQGLQEVLGDIVLDRDAFRLREQDFADTPLPTADRPHHAWPDALTLDEGRLRVNVQAGAGAAGRPQVSVWPALAGVRLDSQVSGGGCSVWAHWQPPPAGAMAGDPSLAVRGQWGRQCGERELQLAPLSHEQFTTRAVLGLWRGAGGRLRGRVIDRRGQRPWPDRDRAAPPAEADATLPGLAEAPSELAPPWSVHQSEPLAQLVRDINKTSDNLAARCLMLSLARGFPQRSATLADARDRLSGWLAQQGLAGDDIVVDNGSGLSRAERGKPRAMVQLLRSTWGTPQGRALLDSLPVAGIDGTLAHRMTRGAATGRAFLKTGSLLDTRALAGYVHAASGTVYAVTALVNHPEAARATPALDRLIEWVAARG